MKSVRVLSVIAAAQLVSTVALADVSVSGLVYPPNIATHPTITNQVSIGYAASAGSILLDANNATNGVTTVNANWAGSISTVIGNGAGSTGLLTVTGNGAASSAVWTGPGAILLGAGGGQGTLNISNGGAVRSTADNSIMIGWDTNSSGFATVSGANSVLSAGERMGVGFGDGSTGTLMIANGGTVRAGTNVGFSDGAMEIGTGVGSSGTVTVTGANSRLETTGFIIGADGVTANTAILNIQNGATVVTAPQAACDLFCGAVSVGSKGGTAQINVTGAGSALQVGAITNPTNFFAGREMFIGGYGQAAVTVDQGAIDASGGHIFVSGGSSGTHFDSATLTVRNGGSVMATEVTVNQGGTLNGAGGTIFGDVILNGGTLAPGNSPGTMNIAGNLNLLTGTLALEYTDLASDFLNVSGNVTFGSGLNLNLLFDSVLFAGQNFSLESFFGGYDSLSFDPAFDLAAQLSIFGAGADSYFSVSLGDQKRTFGTAPPPPSTEVPEPAMPALLALGLMIVWVSQRRRLPLAKAS